MDFKGILSGLILVGFLSGCGAQQQGAQTAEASGATVSKAISLSPGHMYITQVGHKPTTWAFVRLPNGKFEFFSSTIGRVKNLSKISVAELGTPHPIIQKTLNLHGGVSFTSAVGTTFNLKETKDHGLAGTAEGAGNAWSFTGTLFGPPIPLPGMKA